MTLECEKDDASEWKRWMRSGAKIPEIDLERLPSGTWSDKQQHNLRIAVLGITMTYMRGTDLGYCIGFVNGLRIVER